MAPEANPAVQQFADTFTAEAHLTARDCLEQTVAAEPDYVDAWAWLATINNFGYGNDFNARPDDLERALEAAEQAIKLDSTSQIAHYAMALSHFFGHRMGEFAGEAETAIALNPNNANVFSVPNHLPIVDFRSYIRSSTMLCKLADLAHANFGCGCCKTYV